VLIHQLNGKASDIPGSLILRWISYLILFDFKVKHIPGPKNKIADGLSRKATGPSNQLDSTVKKDINNSINIHLNSIQVDGQPKVLDGNYSEDSEELTRYLVALIRPRSASNAYFRSIRRQAQKYFVQGRRLWKRTRKHWDQPQLVEDNLDKQKQVIKSYHKASGHKGREVTVNLVRRRY
jgi:hypothetical protein